jgi:hypothetical protein
MSWAIIKIDRISSKSITLKGGWYEPVFEVNHRELFSGDMHAKAFVTGAHGRKRISHALYAS